MNRSVFFGSLLGLLAGGSLVGSAGCGSGSGGGGGPGTTTDAGSATFAQAYSATLGGVCATAGCHNGASAPGGLDMSSEAAAYANLVGVPASGPSCSTSGLTRVVPGDRSRSLLYLKVAGTPPCGSRMPLHMPALSSAAIAQIGNWIDAGANGDGNTSGGSSGGGASTSGGSSSGNSSSSSSGGSSTSGSGSSGSGGSSGASSGGSSGGWRAFAGNGGAFGQTFDDTTWSTRVVAPQDLTSVTCVGKLDGWVAGAGGVILHTSDGGQTWSPQTSGSTTDLNAVHFGTLGFGVAAGNGGMVLVTGDGGAHWTAVPAVTSLRLRSVAVAAGVAVVVGDGAIVLRSVDSGASWSASAIPGAADLHAVTADAAGHVTLAVDASGGVWRSEDLGASFVREAVLGVALDSVSVSDDGASALAAGAGGSLFVRDALGAWQPAVSPTTADLQAALVTDTAWYAGGQSGTLLGSHDRGATWSWLASGTMSTVRGLDDL